MFLNNEGGEYANFIVQDLKCPTIGTPEFREMYNKFAHRVLWMDDKVVPGAFQMNTAWYFSVPEKDPVFEGHQHPDAELIGFFGSNPDDPYDLGAEIEVAINGERHLLTRSTLMFVPPNVPHMPMSIKKVDRPVFHFSIVTGGTYDNGAYGKTE